MAAMEMLSLFFITLKTVASVRKRTILIERLPLVSEVRANFFEDRECHVVSVTNPYGRILGFLDRVFNNSDRKK
jgi:hypothetical protein